jgi:threonine aldolase
VPRAADVRAAVHRSPHQAPTGLLVLENTHNKAGGTVLPLDRHAELVDAAREEGLPVHLDGARAFNAAVALGVGIDEVVRGVDSVSICLSKGLGAPVGTVLLGSRALLREAHRYRKAFGGGMRQVGVLAAAGLEAIRRGPARLAGDHARARRLAESLAVLPGVAIDMATVQTNMVYLRVDDAASLVDDLRRHGVAANALGATSVRLVTHHQIDDEDVGAALAIIEERLARRAA